MYTILFADDAPDIRGLFCEILRRAGYSVLEAEDGAQALWIARGYRASIDLLITDIAMPRMSGLALRRAFAESHPETPVLFISGNPGTTLVGDSFLAKPFTPAELMGKVKELLASRHIPAVAVSEISPDHGHA